VHDRLYRHGSFQGTQPDGDWIVGPDGHLKPDIALRRRFEHYMLGQGEVTLDELRLLVADESRRDRGDAVSAEVLEMWDKYMRLRNYAWKYQVVIADRGTWMPAFDEQKTVRRQILGPQWAEAFYRDEEDYFVDFMARQEGRAEAPRDPGEPVIQAAPGKDAAALFEEEGLRRSGRGAPGPGRCRMGRLGAPPGRRQAQVGRGAGRRGADPAAAQGRDGPLRGGQLQARGVPARAVPAEPALDQRQSRQLVPTVGGGDGNGPGCASIRARLFIPARFQFCGIRSACS
jgi:hypothetical protein